MDSSDLPLNVSREILQQSRIVSLYSTPLFFAPSFPLVCNMHALVTVLVASVDRFCFLGILVQVKMMRHRLVRKTFEMMDGMAKDENKQVVSFSFTLLNLTSLWRLVVLHTYLDAIEVCERKEYINTHSKVYVDSRLDIMCCIAGLQKVLGNIWEESQVGLYRGFCQPQADCTSTSILF